MRDHRESDLTLLSFEKDFTREVTFAEFLAQWVTKPRRLNVTLYEHLFILFLSNVIND